MEETPILCRYRQTVKELRIGLRNCRIASGQRRKTLGLIFLVILLLILATRQLHDLFFPLGIGAIGSLTVWWIFWRTIRNSPWRDQDVVYTVDQAGYTFEAPSIKSRIEWPRVTSACELSSGFIFFMGQRKRIYIWLPKHGFSSPEDIDRCRALIQEHIKDFRSLG